MEIEENIKEENVNQNNTQNEIENGLISIETEEIGKQQNKFLETTLGRVINTGIDIALRAILPNAIEDEVIRSKRHNNNRWI